MILNLSTSQHFCVDLLIVLTQSFLSFESVGKVPELDCSNHGRSSPQIIMLYEVILALESEDKS